MAVITEHIFDNYYNSHRTDDRKFSFHLDNPAVNLTIRDSLAVGEFSDRKPVIPAKAGILERLIRMIYILTGSIIA